LRTFRAHSTVMVGHRIAVTTTDEAMSTVALSAAGA
jgi:hypothetical protein